MSQFFITISGYVEAEIDYRPFPLFCKDVFQDYAQEVSSHFDKNLRHEGDFVISPITKILVYR